MVGLNRFVFGYRKLSISKDGIATLTNLFLKLGVTSRSMRSGDILISERDYAKIVPYLGVVEFYGFSASGQCGMPRFVKKFLANWFVGIAVLVALAINILFSEIIFDVRVQGNDTVPDYVITEALEKSGVSPGVFWNKLDLNKAEASTLLELPEISWININRRGSVAYVKVAESKNGAASKPPDTRISNIVADRDCIIREINVISGAAQVKPGDVVKRGDVLISGTVEGEFGIELVHASGVVIGESTAQITQTVERRENVSLGVSTHLSEMRLNIFNLSINIFKNYRNSASECDIIEDNETLVVFSDRKLPFGVTRIYERMETYGEVEYTDSRMIEIAHSRHSRALAAYLSGAELVKIKTDGNFTQSGYSVSSDIVYACEVGEEKIIFVNNLGE